MIARVALLVLLALVACGDLTSETRRIVLAAEHPTQPAGTLQQWTATAERYDGTTFDVTALATWSLEPAAIAEVDGGKVTARAQGQATLRAAFDGMVATAAVVVVQAALGRISIATVPQLPRGVAQQVGVVGTFTDGSTGEVTSQASWSTSDPAILEISDTGVMRAIAPGTATLTARVGTLVSTAAVEVTDATLASIDITPDTDTLAKGLDRQHVAIGRFTDGSSLDITMQATWESSAPHVASVTAGLVHARRQGLTTISARLGAGYGALSLQVTAPVLVALALAPQAVVLPRGYVERLVARSTYSDGKVVDVTASASWSSANPDVASIDAAGLARGAAVGTTTITATLDAMSATTSIRITPAVLTALAIMVGEPRIPVGYGEDLVAIGSFDDGSMEHVTETVSWTSSEPRIVVSPAGRATAEAAGSATVTVTHAGVTGTIQLTAVATTVVGVTIAPLSPTLPLGTTLWMTATGRFSDGLDYPLTDDVVWSTSSEQIARISNALGARGLLSPISEGAAQIFAITSDNVQGAQTPVLVTSP